MSTWLNYREKEICFLKPSETLVPQNSTQLLAERKLHWAQFWFSEKWTGYTFG